MNLIEILQNQKAKLGSELDPREQALGEILHNNGKCQVRNEINLTDHRQTLYHKKYTLKDMIKRVLKERRLKADSN